MKNNDNFKSLHLSNVKDLEQFGINWLTGEACAYSMRGLCDLNEDGVELWEEFTSMHVTDKNMNIEVAGKPAINSIMLSRSTIEDLFKYVIWREGYEYAVQHGSEFIGYSDLNSEQLEYLRESSDGFYSNPRGKGPQVDGRNIHQFTGRSR